MTPPAGRAAAWGLPGADAPRQLSLLQRVARPHGEQTLAARVQRLAEAARELGFPRVLVLAGDPHFPEGREHGVAVAVGLATAPPSWDAALAAHCEQVERAYVARRVGDALLLGADEAEAALAGCVGDVASLAAGGAVVVRPLRAAEGALLGVLLAAGALDPAPLGATLDVLASGIALAVESAARAAATARAARRVQRLREVGSRLARSLDEREIVDELARQVERLLPGDVSVHLGGAESLRPVARATDGADADPAGHPVPAQVLHAVARQGHPVRVARDVWPATGAVLAVPMLVGLQLVGIVAVVAPHVERFDAADEEALHAVGAQAAAAIVNARLYAQSERERRRGEALAEVARAVGASLHLDEVLRLILRHAVAVLRSEGAWILLRQGEFLEVVAATAQAQPLAGAVIPLDGSLAGLAVRERRAMIANDAPADPRSYAPAGRMISARRLLLAPLVTAQGAIGALGVMNQAVPYAEDDARTLQALADQVAVAVVNARLFEEVAASTREWAVAFDSIASGMVVLDADGRIVRANRRALALAHAADERALRGRRLDEALALVALPPDEPCAVTAALRGEDVGRVTMRSSARGRLYEVSASPHPAGGAVVTFDDVTALHALRERHRLVVETAADAIVITDRARRVVFANPAAERLFGRPDGVVGAHVSALVAPDADAEAALRQEAALAGAPQRYESRIRRADGTERVVAVSTAPLREVGAVTGVLASLRDVTEERARDAELARSEARYARLVEAASDAIFTVDLEGRITSVNPAFSAGTGRRPEAVVGRVFADLVHPEDRTVARQLFAAMRAGQSGRGELRYPDRAGELRVCSLLASPIVEDGRVVGGLGVARDVTEEKRLALQLLQHEKLAAVGQLVSGVAHELNNPLAGVMAHSQLLLEAGVNDPELRHSAETIDREARRAARIVGNLLTFARQREPSRALIDVNALLAEVLDLRNYALRVHQVAVHLDLDPALPRTWADAGQLQQVFVNLVTNAEHALSDWAGKRRLEVSSRRVGERIVVRVRDTGPGVEPARAERIFNPFFTTKPVGQGTGLGLSLSHGIVREHGGSIRVESVPGRGATFVVELPVTAAPTPEAAEPAPAAASVPRASRAPSRPRAVLVVDDERAIRDAVTRFLGRAGYDVEAVSGGVEALRRLAERHFDAVLLDLRMPDLSGDAVWAEIAERDPELARHVIFVTGDVRSEQALRFIASTGCASLSKPFHLEELARLLEAELAT